MRRGWGERPKHVRLAGPAGEAVDVIAGRGGGEGVAGRSAGRVRSGNVRPQGVGSQVALQHAEGVLRAGGEFVEGGLNGTCERRFAGGELAVHKLREREERAAETHLFDDFLRQ